MLLTAFGKKPCRGSRRNAHLLLLFLLNLLFCVHINGQSITLSVTDAPLEAVIKQIQQQTEYRFVYTDGLLQNAHRVSVSIHSLSLEPVLQLVFSNQPLQYTIEQKVVILKLKEPLFHEQLLHAGIDISGKIIDEQNEPIQGATVLVKGKKAAAVSDKNGLFEIKDILPNDILLISSVGYEPREIHSGSKSNLVIQLRIAVSALDETVVKGYYSTTKMLNTGSVGRISAADIGKQPVSNVLATMAGTVPGLVSTAGSGIPGSSFKLQIRGRNSIAQSNDPFIIIDGVPFAPNNANINQISGAFTFQDQGLSPFNSINPADIESIEILKDADATAIYGSRGANGVVLITTKKGKVGKTRVDVALSAAASRLTQRPALLNTADYIRLRKEAFVNDGVVPDVGNAYDLLVWDTTRYTDFSKALIGGTAASSNAQLTISGGQGQTSFLIGGTYHRETTVYPGHFSDARYSSHFNIHHASTDQRFNLNFTGSFSSDNSGIPAQDFTAYTGLVPNLPALKNSDGSLNWSSGGINYGTNPYALLLQQYKGQTDNLLGNLQMSYQILKGLSAKINVGYNSVRLSEISTQPIASQDPGNDPKGSASFGNSSLKSLILEPQLMYKTTFKKIKLDILAGTTLQKNTARTSAVYGTGYVNDALLQSLGAAGSLLSSNQNTDYKYGAAFGRIGLSYDNRYILNLTARRDGSSRFGPGKQYASFGAVGAGWIFSNEEYIKKNLPFISYGKLRMSYGTSGNDGIGDYRYLDTYKPTVYPYQGNPGLYPSALFNPGYGWETNKKWETAIELGLWKDRLSMTAAFFRNRSGNQLVEYGLPAQTGFRTIIKNLPAQVQNTGFEWELSSSIIDNNRFKWSMSFNITIPRNKLLAFPGLSSSSYSDIYVLGRSLNLGYGFSSAGVDPATGVYLFKDVNGKPTSNPDYTTDYVKDLVTLDPKYYGGLNNVIQYKDWQLQVMLEFRKQEGYSYLADLVYTPPGTIANQPVIINNRWVQNGDMAPVQKATQDYNSPATQAYNNFAYYGASNLYSNASYLRVKNTWLAYSPTAAWIHHLRLSAIKIFIAGQNLWTFTPYKGTDPETQHFFRLPPLKTISIGLQASF